MSEDFDKEAEREKLREQFERDEKRRQATRKMSDLLLKGATMTNKHCDQCGSPIFRYEGQEFCPECQAVVGEGGEGDAAGGTAAGNDASEARSRGEAGTTDAADAAPSEPGETGAANRTAPEQSADAPTTADASEPTLAPDPSDAASSAADSDIDHPTVQPGRGEQSTRQADPRRTAPVDSADVPVQSEAADLGDAQTALQQTLIRFATHAAETDDPRQAREYLAAAREAAETLAALRR